MITTFEKFGNLKLPIEKLPTNQADQSASYFIATGVIPGDGTIQGDLHDAEGNLVARGRVYQYSGLQRNMPCTDLDTGQEEYLSGEAPHDKWNKPEIEFWMRDRQQPDEQGVVLADDPYDYNELATKTDLLRKITKNADQAAQEF